MSRSSTYAPKTLLAGGNSLPGGVGCDGIHLTSDLNDNISDAWLDIVVVGIAGNTSLSIDVGDMHVK